jgi:hypothetical protein
MKRATLSRIERLELKATATELKPILNVSVIVRSPGGNGETRAAPLAEWRDACCRLQEQR